MRKIICFCIMLISILASNAQVKIEMEHSGGVYKVPCSVNGAKMKFVFDTGAASVSLSKAMFDYLIDNDYLSEDDLQGYGNFRDATGKVSTNRLLIIRDLEISGLHIYNIQASVSNSQNAPLLLGQSAIRKLGLVTIDGNTLVIKTSEVDGDVMVSSFLGCKFGDTRENVSVILSNRFGNDFFYLDYNTDWLEKLYINGICFKTEFEYDNDSRFVSATLMKDYSINELSRAKKDFSNISKFYAKKYPDLTALKDKEGKTYYGCGGTYHNDSRDLDFYSILIFFDKRRNNKGYHIDIIYFMYNSPDGQDDI